MDREARRRIRRFRKGKAPKKRGTGTFFACLAVFVLIGAVLAGLRLLQDRRGFPGSGREPVFRADKPSEGTASAAPDSIPDWAGEDWIVLSDNVPNFTEYDLASLEGEHYSELDRLGRCGPAWARLDWTMLPTEPRGEIDSVRPSGFRGDRYPDLIDTGFLYNRCHLIAWGLTGQNANERNLITGTRYMNTVSMLSFESRVMQFLYNDTGPVLYRVTPLFRGRDLVARGVEMEALSVSDAGGGLCFHVFVYNIQPGVTIDYATGESRRTG